MFTAAANIISGLSLKSDGNMTVYPNPGDQRPARNRQKFFHRLGLNTEAVTALQLVHGNKVAAVDGGSRGKLLTGYDALITNQPGVILTITVADCLPLYFYDQRKKIIALAHAGWRGVLAEISKNVVAAFISHYDSSPADLEVFIGPHLQACHFEVQDDVASQFSAYSEFIISRDKIFIDLAGIVRHQLLRAGVTAANIRVSEECTYERPDKYFSYRRAGGELRVQVAYLGRK
jgi:YfiH family protein